MAEWRGFVPDSPYMKAMHRAASLKDMGAMDSPEFKSTKEEARRAAIERDAAPAPAHAYGSRYDPGNIAWPRIRVGRFQSGKRNR